MTQATFILTINSSKEELTQENLEYIMGDIVARLRGYSTPHTDLISTIDIKYQAPDNE